jgi:hypothetical protein
MLIKLSLTQNKIPLVNKTKLINRRINAKSLNDLNILKLEEKSLEK